ncbi:MAG TPA: glycosyltransferase [Rubricoccaceae bacterium]|jgi:glycosyltransferase involved in cell wall biosynthesis
MTVPTLRLCVLWPRLGPYHLARLRAANALFAVRGAKVIAVETAGTDSTYAWREEVGEEPFRRVQVFPGAAADALAPATVAAGITQVLDRLDPAVVAINSYAAPDALAALAWCRARRRAAVCMTDSTAGDARRTAVREWVKGHIVREFDAALVSGRRTVAYVGKLGIPAARVFTPYDVVDNAFFAAAGPPRPDLPGLASGTPFFLASNRFVGRKNVSGLLMAYARFRASGGTWRLVLLGDGPERPTLDALVRTHAVPDVTFAGFQQIEALPAYYAAAAAFVHPALMDQWGLVINEAMAAGCPVVVSERAGASADLIVDGETGFRFDPSDTEALAGLLGRVSTMPEADRVAVGRRGQAYVGQWTPEAFAAGLWDATAAALTVPARGLSPVAWALMRAQRAAVRRADSFHAIRE